VGSGHTSAKVGAEATENPKKKLKPFFTSASGQKRTQGKSLWNLEGMKYFHQAEKNGSRFMIIRRICECSTMGERDGLQLREQT
jgi:hypothetical protein